MTRVVCRALNLRRIAFQGARPTVRPPVVAGCPPCGQRLWSLDLIRRRLRPPLANAPTSAAAHTVSLGGGRSSDSLWSRVALMGSKYHWAKTIGTSR